MSVAMNSLINDCPTPVVQACRVMGRCGFVHYSDAPGVIGFGQRGFISIGASFQCGAPMAKAAPSVGAGVTEVSYLDSLLV